MLFYFLLNIAEHEIFSANKDENANNCWHFHIYLQRKFYAQLTWARKKVYNLGAMLFIAEHENISANKYENSNIFMLRWVEHETSFITSGPVVDHSVRRQWSPGQTAQIQRQIWAFFGGV